METKPVGWMRRLSKGTAASDGGRGLEIAMVLDNTGRHEGEMARLVPNIHAESRIQPGVAKSYGKLATEIRLFSQKFRTKN